MSNQERIAKMETALKLAHEALRETCVRLGGYYNWNADPDYITLKLGAAFQAIEAVLETGTPAETT